MSKKHFTKIAIDGGAATGKSTIAVELAKKLKFEHINTGMMYRLITFYALKNNLINDENKLKILLLKQTFAYKNNKLISSIRYNKGDLLTKEINENISKIADSKLIRSIIMNLQKKIILNKERIVVEGRDIGTEIMPDADFKFYLLVSPKEAAKRRFIQTKTKTPEDFQKILKNIKFRNENDSNRKLSPLKPAKDAIIINTETLTVKEIINIILMNLKNKI